MDKRRVLNALETEAIVNDYGYVEIPEWVYNAVLKLLHEQTERRIDPTDYFDWDNECRNG